jgi:uncharacterized protein
MPYRQRSFISNKGKVFSHSKLTGDNCTGFPLPHLRDTFPDPTLASMSLNDTIIADLTSAMKAKDADRLSTLRMVKANLMNRQIEKGGVLTDDEVIKALQSLVKQRRDSVESYQAAGRSELAERELSEIAVIEAYLPRAATLEEIQAAVAEAVSQTGASSIKDMGNVMKAAMANLAGRSADGKLVSDTVRAKLQ